MVLSVPSSMFQAALAAHRAGISCLPIRADGTKRPLMRWKASQQRLPTPEELHAWFAGPREVGLAYITGQVSGGLELLDFDSRSIYHAWTHRLRTEGQAQLVDRLEEGYLELSPGGVHLLFRCAQVAGNQRLARRPLEGVHGRHTLIETRGEGGYGIVAPSGPGIHPSHRPYCLLSGGVETIPTLTPRERALLLDRARSFDAAPPVRLARTGTLASPLFQERPGDRFNRRTSWEELLPRYGWTRVGACGEVRYWRRPGKRGPGISATTNYAGRDLLYVFSTATVFEPARAYTKWTAYALLEHGGDFAAAVRALALQAPV